MPPAGVECKDGVCSIVNKAAAASTSKQTLEEKIIADWKRSEGDDGASEFEEDTFESVISSAAAVLGKSGDDYVADEAAVAEVVKLGYSREEAVRALQLTTGDVTAAATMLEEEEEELEQLRQDAQLLVSEHDWDEAAAFAALQQCDGNRTAAHELLTTEERYLQQNFEESVEDMVR